MQFISSVKNEQIKKLKKLHTKKGRRQQQRYLLEGEHLVQEALAAKVELSQLYVTQDFINHDVHHLIKQYHDQTTQITPEVAQSLAETITPQGIFAVTNLVKPALPTSWSGQWLLLDQVQDPGNVGTMVRTADAAGLKGVVLSSDSVDVYQSKVQRAMQGSQFHLPVFTADLLPVVTQMQQQKIPVWGTLVDRQAISYQQIAPQANWALIMGNEAHGLSSTLTAMTDQNIYIPLSGQAESLNVAVAAGVLMFSLR